MRREDKWLNRWNEIMRFMDVNNRNPSKYRQEEMVMVNWLKSNRKKRNAGRLEPDRIDKFKQLTDRMQLLYRDNQYTPPVCVTASGEEKTTTE